MEDRYQVFALASSLSCPCNCLPKRLCRLFSSRLRYHCQEGRLPELNGVGVDFKNTPTPPSNLNSSTHPPLASPRTRTLPGPPAGSTLQAPDPSLSSSHMTSRSSQTAPSQTSEPTSTSNGNIRHAQLRLPHTPFVERSECEGGLWQSPELFGDASSSPEVNLGTPYGWKKDRRPSGYGYFDYGATAEQALSSQSFKPNTPVRPGSTRVNTPGGRRKACPTVLKAVEREIPTDSHRRQSVYRES